MICIRDHDLCFLVHPVLVWNSLVGLATSSSALVLVLVFSLRMQPWLLADRPQSPALCPSARTYFASWCTVSSLAHDSLPGPGSPSGRRIHQHRRSLLVVALLFLAALAFCTRSATRSLLADASRAIHRAHDAAVAFDWVGETLFRMTRPICVTLLMSLFLGTVLGFAVGLLHGPEPAVVIGVSGSMALGYVFVLAAAILQGVNVLRASFFSAVVSGTLPLGFGLGFGSGCLCGGKYIALSPFLVCRPCSPPRALTY